MVLRAFRCQRRGYSHEREILASICAELYYQGRYVWMRSCRNINLTAIDARGPNRIRYRLVSTTNYKCLPLSSRDRRVSLGTDSALAAMPVIKNRRRTMFLFVRPEFMSDHRWDTASSNILSPEEIMFLVGKEQPADLELVVCALCRFRQLIDGYGALTKEGRRILTHYVNL